MTDQDCILLLQWALPRLRLQWTGFRKVRRQVCKRISWRMRELDLPDAAAYCSYLKQRPDEWQVLDSLCRVTISRFFRDKRVFQFLEQQVLPYLAYPLLAGGEHELRCWSIGCASGEEPYTLAILWETVFRTRFPGIMIMIVATDADETMMERSRGGCYTSGSLKELPVEWVARAFKASGRNYCISDDFKERVTFLRQDIRKSTPEGRFHLVLCRNSVFTYFDEGLQEKMLEQIAAKLLPGGALVIGIHESLPRGQGREQFEVWSDRLKVFRKGTSEMRDPRMDLPAASCGNLQSPRFKINCKLR
ncbi:MAG: chemotaxis protein CheR [Syntrophaceae bacterium]|nr:chemotaxis protein CheR [Syntrophaceae bacterium]